MHQHLVQRLSSASAHMFLNGLIRQMVLFLTETCSNTDGGHEGQTQSSLTLAAPAHKFFGEGLEAAASISGSISGTDIPAIVYTKGSEGLQSPPTDPGTYTASITAGGATASVSYTIAPKEVTVTAKDQTIREGESITDGPGQAVLEGALQGAEFKLYKAEECEDTDEYKGNELFKNGAIIVSDEDGRLTVQGQTKPGIRGLDAGTYYLRETKAPDGYIKAQDPVKIEIIPTYKTTTKTETADGIQITWDYQELDGYVVKIANVITASYTMTNEKPDHGDTVVGTDDTSGKIQNTQGVELPSTGGIGTTIFYVLGTILALGAGTLLVTGRRMKAG